MARYHVALCQCLGAQGEYEEAADQCRRATELDATDAQAFRGLAEALAQSVSLDFGIGVILIGTALLIAAAVVPEKKA